MPDAPIERSALGLLLTMDGQVILAKPKDGKEWNGIGGTIRENEWGRGTLVRKFAAVAGIETKWKDWHLVAIMADGDREIQVYSGVSEKAELACSQIKDIVVGFADILDLPPTLNRQVRYLLPFFFDPSLVLPVHLSYKNPEKEILVDREDIMFPN